MDFYGRPRYLAQVKDYETRIEIQVTPLQHSAPRVIVKRRRHHLMTSQITSFAGTSHKNGARGYRHYCDVDSKEWSTNVLSLRSLQIRTRATGANQGTFVQKVSLLS